MQNYHNNTGGAQLAGWKSVEKRVKTAVEDSGIGRLVFNFYVKITQKDAAKPAELDGAPNSYVLLFKELYKKSVSSRPSQSSQN